MRIKAAISTKALLCAKTFRIKIVYPKTPMRKGDAVKHRLRLFEQILAQLFYFLEERFLNFFIGTSFCTAVGSG